jgi:hypothetical protein
MWTVLKGESISELMTHMRKLPYSSKDANIASWIERVEARSGPTSDNVPILWIKHMLECERDQRWSAHLVTESIRGFNADQNIQYSYIGRCCLDEEESAESVISYIDETHDSTNSQSPENITAATSSGTREAFMSANRATNSVTGIPVHQKIISRPHVLEYDDRGTAKERDITKDKPKRQRKMPEPSFFRWVAEKIIPKPENLTENNYTRNSGERSPRPRRPKKGRAIVPWGPVAEEALLQLGYPFIRDYAVSKAIKPSLTALIKSRSTSSLL